MGTVLLQRGYAMFTDEMLRIEDVAAYLKLKPQTIYKWAKKGTLPGAKFGKEWRFKRSAIEDWIDSYLQGSQDGDTAAVEKQEKPAPARGTKPKKTRARAKKKARGPSRN